jgi:asparagine synthase (glutamine-hydrolysing)
MLSRMTRGYVTVALSGDGGDELFHGYTRYAKAEKFLAFLQLPSPLRQITLGFMRRLPNRHIRNWAHVLAAGDIASYYARQLSWRASELTGRAEETLVTGQIIRDLLVSLPPDRQRKLPALADFLLYMPDDILTKVDRASMAVSLETRVPLLDNCVIEFAAKLPLKMKYRRGIGKYLLRKVLARHVPQELWDRPKQGFAIPLGRWFREELRGWVQEELLAPGDWTLGYFPHSTARRLIQAHLAGRGDHSHFIWAFLAWKFWVRKVGLLSWQS